MSCYSLTRATGVLWPHWGTEACAVHERGSTDLKLCWRQDHQSVGQGCWSGRCGVTCGTVYLGIYGVTSSPVPPIHLFPSCLLSHLCHFPCSTGSSRPKVVFCHSLQLVWVVCFELLEINECKFLHYLCVKMWQTFLQEIQKLDLAHNPTSMELTGDEKTLTVTYGSKVAFLNPHTSVLHQYCCHFIDYILYMSDSLLHFYLSMSLQYYFFQSCQWHTRRSIQFLDFL